MLRDAFFPERLQRLNYFFRVLALNLVGLLLLTALDDGIDIGGIPMVLEIVALAVVIYGALFVYRPRVKDCGMPTWTLIFGIVPYIAGLYGIILLLRPSELSFLNSTDISLSHEASDEDS